MAQQDSNSGTVAGPLPALPAQSVQREFAHQLNNLLAVILANSENSLASEDPAELKRALVLVVQTSATMASLVRAYAQTSPPTSVARERSV